MIIRRVIVSGRVQGVGFRAATERQARRLGVQGYVRNLPDGRVEALVAGEATAVLELVSWCSKGPSLSRVERLEVTEEPSSAVRDFREFLIRY